VLEFIVDYLLYLAATLYHVLEFLNSSPAFAACPLSDGQLVMMSMLEHHMAITISCRQTIFGHLDSCFHRFFCLNAEYYCALLFE